MKTRRASPWLALAILTGVTTVGFIDRIVVNSVVEPIKAEFGLSDAQVGLVTGFAFAALYVLLGIFMARLAERKRRLTLISVGTLLWSIATALCGLAGTWTQLLLARVGVGVGEAVGLPPNQSVIADYFPPSRRATAMSVLLLAPPIGAFVGGAGGAIVAHAYGWRMAFLVAAVPGVILALLVHLFIAEPKRGQHDTGDVETVPPIRAVLGRLWNVPTARHLMLGSSIASMCGFGLNAFFTSLLIRRFDVSLAEAGIMLGLLASLPAALAVFLGGWLSDRLGPTRPSAYAVVPGVSILIGLPFYLFGILQDNYTLLLVCVGAASLFLFTYLGVTYGTLQNLMQARMRATAYAILNAIYAFMAGLGPFIIGSISDRFQRGGTDSGQALAWALAITSLVYLWAALHYLLAARHVGTDLGRVANGEL